MANLSTSYMGIKLKNPIIAGASNLVNDIASLKKMEAAGVSAIVYKSLFEEQIQLENLDLHQHMSAYNDRNAEMINLFPDIEHAGPEEYLMNLAAAKRAVNIPLIGSLNAVNKDTWVEYAKKIEAVGVDGLELNLYSHPYDFEACGKDIIAEQLDIVKNVVEAVKIPVAVKLSPYYTNILSVIRRMDDMGVKGFVLFNRLFQPDIDIENENNFYPYNLSHSGDNRLPLRYAGLCYGNIQAPVCASNGIHSGHDVIKMMLAGAGAVQVVSALYKNKIDYVGTMLHDLEQWMKSKNYQSLDDFRGKLSRKEINDPYAYKRSQYVDIIMHSDKIFNNFPVV